MMRALMVLVLVTGCGSLCTVNRVGMAAAVAATAIDWCQTTTAASVRMGPWEDGRAAMILGSAPSSAAVDAYFAVVIIGALAITSALPEQWRPAAWGGVLAGEVFTVADNLSSTNCAGIGGP